MTLNSNLILFSQNLTVNSGNVVVPISQGGTNNTNNNGFNYSVSSGRTLLTYGNNVSGATFDGASDYQAYFFQTQPTFLTTGSLGAIYGQRLATYIGGAVNDAVTPVTGAVRGYTQVQSQINYCNESAGLFVTDNYSWLGQAVGVFGHVNSYHGGRAFGLEAEAVEYPEIFTATAGQTKFIIPNNFPVGQSIVVKNGTTLTSGVNYTETAIPASTSSGSITSMSGSGTVVTVTFSGGFTPPVDYSVDISGAVPNAYNGRFRVLTSSSGNVTLSSTATGTVTVLGTLAQSNTLAGSITLSSAASLNDSIIVIRGNPQFGVIGGEVIVYGAGGTDDGNAISGSRVGLAVSGYRTPGSPSSVPLTIGTILSIVADPTDSNLTAHRGILFQGRIGIGIDFTASNVTFSTFLMKFNTSGAGVIDGTLLKLTDGSAGARFQSSSGSGVIVGSETNIDFILWRNAAEQARFASTSFYFKNSNYSVGIGTTSPNSSSGYSWLTINGTSASALSLSLSDSEKSRIFVNSGALYIDQITSLPVIIQSNNTEVIRATYGTAALGTGLSLALGPASTSYANDTLAATGGVPVGGVYRNGSILQIRIS